MPREEFKTMRSCLHFVDTELPPEKPEENRLWKVQPIIDAVRKRCHELDRAPVSYSIDEQIIPFSGRCSLRQYVKEKPRPLGLKNFVLTTSAGLVMDFEVYHGKSTPLADTSLGLGPNVVLRLVETLPKNSSVCFDRYFTTIPLLDALIDKAIDGTGTIMTNRVKNINFRSDTAMKQGDFPEFRRVDGKAVIVKWKDSKSVTIASTCTGASPVESVKRWSKKTKEYIDVPSPAVVRRYNSFMGGVDVCDQLVEYYRISIKTKKWTLKVSLHMPDLSLVNAWMEYREACRRNGMKRRETMELLEFHLAIGEALCASPKRCRSDDGEARGLPDTHVDKAVRVARIPGVDKRLDGFDHIPMVDPIKNARCCTLPGCLSRSQTHCTKCDVYLCLTSERNCFKTFHTKA